MRAACAGSVLALVLDLVMLSDGQLNLWRQMGFLGSFFDAQGRALLHGHLAVPPSSVSFEGFVVGGHTYMYFGPVLAVLRIPVLLVTHALDGRLSQLSMLLALIVLMSSGACIHWRLRELVRPGAPLGRRERVAAFLLALALGAGGCLCSSSAGRLFISEAELWGAALALAAVNAVFAVAERPTAKRIAWAGVLSTLAINTRVSVGLAPIIALAFLAVGLAAREVGDRLRLRSRAATVVRTLGALGPAEPNDRGRTFAGLAICILIAAGLEVAVNQAKFHTPFGLPMYDHVNFRIDPMERAAVLANHGAVIGTQYLPTALLAAIRPDAVGLFRAFPFVGLPQSVPTVIGSARFVGLLPSLSAITSMPLFCLLLIGLPTVPRNARMGPVLGVLAGSAAAFVPTLLVSSVATRYLGDLLPFLWVGACTGLQGLLGAPRVRAAIRSRGAGYAAVGAIGIFTLAGIVVNGSVGIVQQRLLAPTATLSQRASFVRSEDDIDRFLGRSPHGVHSGASLPSGPLGRVGDLFVLGRCDGLYVQGFGGTWLPVERTARAGLHELLVHFPAPQSTPTPQALLSLGAGAGRVSVTVVGARPGRAVFSVRVGGRVVATGAPVTVVPRTPTPVTVSIDPLNGGSFLSVVIAGGTAVTAPVPYDRLARPQIGADPADPSLARFSGAVAAVGEATPVCDHVAARAHLL